MTISEQTKSADLMRAAKSCDSYGEVEQIEDAAQTHPHGRYGVMCFFDTPEDATAFRQAVAVAGC